MPARPHFFVVALPVVAALAPLHAATPADAPETPADPVEQAWQKTALYLFKESFQTFRDLRPQTRETRLGHAALLLLQQPKTAANLDRAVAGLEQLAAAAGPAPADEPAIAARYLLGRVAHVHRSPADLPAAAAHYRRLIAEHPDHLLSDQARIKLAIIELYAPGLARDELLARLDHLDAQADALARPASRRDLHLVLAGVCDNLRLDETRALRHYLAADAAGIERPVLRANVTVAIGELARRLGQDDLARRYFDRYLAEFSRDYRRTLVKDKLAALAAPSASSPPALAQTPPALDTPEDRR